MLAHLKRRPCAYHAHISETLACQQNIAGTSGQRMAALVLYALDLKKYRLEAPNLSVSSQKLDLYTRRKSINEENMEKEKILRLKGRRNKEMKDWGISMPQHVWLC